MGFILNFIVLTFYFISFRFFLWLLCVEILMVRIFFISSFYKSSTVYLCRLLVLGACEVGVALRIIVASSRFRGLEKTKNLRCEKY